MTTITKNKFIIIFFLVFLFLLTNIVSPNLLNSNTHTVYAESTALISSGLQNSSLHFSGHNSPLIVKSEGGNFKSGSFSKPKSEYKSNYNGGSSSSSGDFKSGSFSNSPKSDSKSYKNNSSPSNGNYDTGNKRSFFPIPIPIPWGQGNYSFGNTYGQTSLLWKFFWGFVKFIIVILIIIFIVNKINNFRRK